ncbi:hypothetical protein GCM10011348_12460 [Marinobacterium nitratireducens]|uniref:2Fe-2S ferredoxin-type domain-containing protein n=1 Tax=Marinobacterium nitratireducens TaxID=518897 RepID=A0A917ZCF9_9GAMM|nr:hypothetical protein GCM10011348_12460 [Marinobacterium nitratireducens]
MRFAESGIAASVALGSNLNEAALEVGVHIPKVCGIGICGACRVQLVSGSVNMMHNGGISDEEIAKGYVLSCCSEVTGDLEVEC